MVGKPSKIQRGLTNEGDNMDVEYYVCVTERLHFTGWTFDICKTLFVCAHSGLEKMDKNLEQ